MNTQSFWMFAFASLMLNITPGNDMIYVASRSMGQGIRAGIISAFGIMVGCMVHTLAAVAGLSAIIAGSATAFNTIKFAGALYLIYLGSLALIKKQSSLMQLKEKSQPLSDYKIFSQGVLTNVLNPKVALFFLAFLPQFIDIKQVHPQRQILFLGLWFDCSGTLVNIFIAILFGKLGNWFSKSKSFLKVQQKITGCLLIALGIKLAVTNRAH
jgi:threonine/homoserine/homoserine lactone efflux protein